jgi:hypothetical protein
MPPVANKQFRCQELIPTTSGANKLNPEWEEKLEALITGGKTETEAITQLESENIVKIIKPNKWTAVFVNPNKIRDRLQLSTNEETKFVIGQLYKLTLE